MPYPFPSNVSLSLHEAKNIRCFNLAQPYQSYNKVGIFQNIMRVNLIVCFCFPIVCLNTWTVVPSVGTMTNSDCNVLDKDVTIISTCTVSNVTVHWYYSQERASAGVNGSILPGIRQGISVNSRCVLGQVRLCSAQLSITNIRTLDEGYYWCEVDVDESQGFVGHPSSVLRISGCDTLNLCSTMQSFRTNIMREFGCAVSDTGSDIARNNLTFVDLYSDSCPPGPTTPEKVTTTKVEEEGSPSTVLMVPIMTSEPKPDFETTAMSSATSTFNTVATTIITENSTSSSTTTTTSNSTSASSSSSNSSSSIDSSGGEISSTSVVDEAATSLALAIIWPVIGGVIGLLLIVVTILLALVLMQCRKKRGRGKSSQSHL